MMNKLRLWLLCFMATVTGQVLADSYSYVYSVEYQNGEYTTTGAVGTTFNYGPTVDNTNDSWTETNCKYDNGIICATVFKHNPSSEQITIRIKKQDGGYFANNTSGKIWFYYVGGNTMYKPFHFSITNSTTKFIDAVFNNFPNFNGSSHAFRVFMKKSDGQKFYGGEISISGHGIFKPVASTGKAVPSSTSAKLYGSVTPNGAATDWWFIYGTNILNLNRKSEGARVNGGDTANISEEIDGLTPGQTYYYCLVASNSEGEKEGTIQSFTTDAPSNSAPNTPSYSYPSNGAPNVSTSATLKWSCSDPDGDDLTYDVYIGTTTSNWKKYTTAEESYSPTLDTNTKYVWKVVASDGQAKTEGAVWSFTTAASDTPAGDCPFPDCENDEQKTAATYLYNKGVVEGISGKLMPKELITREQIAKATLYGVYLGKDNVPSVIPSDNYPSVYELQEKTWFYRAVKALLYLEYGDGVSPFDRNRLTFDSKETMARVDVLKLLMEAFNVKPEMSGNNYFSDVEQLAKNNPRKMGYVRAAASQGIISTSLSNFRPYDKCKRSEAFLMLYRLMLKAKSTPSDGDYFQPLNVTLKTIALGLGLQMGNFQHYTKTSFMISGLVPLAFAHTYNSYNTTLPEVFYGAKEIDGFMETYQPLGDGWSHNYHSFITLVGSGSDARAIVHWGGGSIDVYKYNGSSFEPESYGVYDKFQRDGNDYVVKSKSQMEYRFSNQGGSGATVLYLSSVTDRNGNTLTLSYESGENGSKRISSVSDPSGRQLSFSYNQSGTNLLTSVSDPAGRSISFSYEKNPQTGRYRLSRFTDAKRNTTTYEYDDNNGKLLTRIQLPNGNYINNQYDANNRLTQTKNGDSKTTVDVKTSYDSSVSTSSEVEITRSKDTSTYRYQFNGNNMVTSMSGPKGLKMSSEYYTDASMVHLPKSIDTNSMTISNIKYDTNGNVTQIDVDGGTEGTLTTKMTYTELNDIKTVTDPMGYTTTYEYENGNLKKIQSPISDIYTMFTPRTDGLLQQVTNPEGIVTKYDYNSYGNLKTITLPTSLTTTFGYDDNTSWLKSVTDALNRTYSYDYDKNDNLISEKTPKGYTTSFDYDDNDNLTTITNAKRKQTTLEYDYDTDRLLSVSFGGATKSYSYNPDGTLKSYTKPDLTTTLDYEYDELGRLKSDGVNSYNYDSKLRLQSISGKGKTISFDYDGFNRIVKAGDATYTYDKNGNCKSIKNTTYDYDKLNRLTEVTFSGKTINYTYKKDGRLEKVEYPNGVMTTSYGYDKAGRLTNKTTTLKNGTVVASYSFELDNAGNIKRQTAKEPFSDILLTNEEVSYEYNDANRIKKAGDTSFEFDDNGNTTKRDNELYQWDEFDRLVRAGDTDIKYNPLGQIVSYGDITFTTSPLGMGNVLSDSESGADYIYGNGLEARVIGGKASYYVTDFRGSVVAIVDENGKVTHKYQYDEFGKVTQKEEADYNPFQYVGKYGVMYLNEHLYYMRARHYDPIIGRFLSEDPIWSTNLYPYADNNPIMGIDPRGTDCKFVTTSVNLTTGKSEGYWKCDNSVSLAGKEKYQKPTVATSTSGLTEEEAWHQSEQYKSAYSYIMSQVDEGPYEYNGPVQNQTNSYVVTNGGIYNTSGQSIGASSNDWSTVSSSNIYINYNFDYHSLQNINPCFKYGINWFDAQPYNTKVKLAKSVFNYLGIPIDDVQTAIEVIRTVMKNG